MGLDGNDAVAVFAAATVGLVGVGTDLDVAVVVFVPTNDDPPPPPLLKAGAVNFNPSIKAGTTATALDLYNFGWN